MKEWTKDNWWKILLFIAIFIVGIPLLLNWMYKQPAPSEFLHVRWDISSELLYYGGILASLITIYGVFYSIQISQKNNRDDTRRKVLPFLTVTQKIVHNENNIFTDFAFLVENEDKTNETQEDPIYVEYNLSQIYFVIKDGKVINYTKLPKEYDDMIKHHGIKKCHNNQRDFQQVPFISIPLEVENVGNGPAIHLRIGLSRVGEIEKALVKLKLKCAQTFYIHIISLDCESEQEEKYLLFFIYNNIFGQVYRQDYLFRWEKGECTYDLTDNQMFIKGELKDGSHEV